MTTRPPGHDALAPLIPWYVNGTLGDDDRAAVREHLTTCAECRELAGPAVAFRDLVQRLPGNRLLDHVQAQLLVEFEEAPETMESEARSWVTSHLSGCDPCREAAAILRDLRLASGAAGGARSLLTRLWDGLSRTLLQPLPALAYLVLLLIALPVLRWTLAPGPAGTEPVAMLPPPQILRAPIDFRGGSPTPLSIEVVRVEAGQPLLLEVDPDLDREDLDDPGAAFEAELRIGGVSILVSPFRPEDFDAGGRLRLLVPASQVPASGEGEILLRISRSGELRDGEILFRVSFRIAPVSSP